MKNIPKQIYIQIDPEREAPEDFNDLEEITWSEDEINDNDIKYYRDDLVQDIVNFFAKNYIPKKHIEDLMEGNEIH